MVLHFKKAGVLGLMVKWLPCVEIIDAGVDLHCPASKLPCTDYYPARTTTLRGLLPCTGRRVQTPGLATLLARYPAEALTSL